MINTEWYSIRTLTLPATAVALLITFFIVWLILRLQFSKKWSELYSDAIFTFIIVWKLSLLVTDFKTVVNNPITLLYFNGGTMGVLLGVIVASLQILRKRQSIQLEEQEMIAGSWAIILTQSIYQMLAVLLNDNNTSSEVITLAVLSVVTLVILWRLVAVKQALILYTISYLIVAILQPLGIGQTAVGVSVILLCLGLTIQHERINVGGKK
ncbi:hypothetical protein M5J14_18090 [Lysinibacillus sp. OL1_EC]|uniref:hypothetical protein n=1 Tax=unclassified Lysinibacillus TaxID=2636778 RepID=UPI00103EEB65|nr:MULTISPECIES: hypothetical protein [unclassified Lysinibacillus]MCM0626409.1 hypothetical protein [Lysinibacillus sp. OL1_EC]TBV85724.1 hypothetical protein EW028_20075 [Lysinibacillus sp. OL1]UKJ46069.1 hypothetical protein L6W14_03260 [Lysinibacillus sp. ACHW1.5]